MLYFQQTKEEQYNHSTIITIIQQQSHQQMNFYTSEHHILSLALSEKERNHTSRDRHAYHVFLSSFCSKFKALEYNEKKRILVDVRVWQPDNDSDSKEDSVLTQPNPQGADMMKAAGRVWKDMNDNMKRAWKTRATRLNGRPPNDGKFVHAPYPLLETTVLDSLTMDWRHLVSLLRQSVIMNVKKFQIISEATYMFGNEQIILNRQAYRSFF